MLDAFLGLKAVFPWDELTLGLLASILWVGLAMLHFARVFCGVFSLPTVQSIARDAIVCVIGFLFVAYFHATLLS